MERSAFGDSDMGSCTEAPQIVTTVREPVEQGAEETPLIGGKACLPVMEVGRTWSAWQRKSALLAFEPIVSTDVALPKGGRGRLGSGGLLRGTLAIVSLGLPLAASRKPGRGPAHPESSGANL